MRLLQAGLDGGGFVSINFDSKNIPPYAILSHTWGEDDEEITFEDLTNGASEAKPGWKKLIFCSRQAQKDSLRYFWIDTCCIDKRSSAELQESLNSMFQWYHKAARCYVYLSDVSNARLTQTNLLFDQSRWFTRGWTLQELLAPTFVEFFSAEGDLLGDKRSRMHEISKVTSIPVEALQGRALSEFSIDERLNWAKNRRTKRDEDEAYALLGIFDIQMPLMYGEGKEKALKRLKKEIRDELLSNESLKVSQERWLGKVHKWLTPPDPSTNHLKAQKLREAETGLWFVNGVKFAQWKAVPTSRMWLYGIPGCGKTILGSTIIRELLQHCDDSSDRVVVYFYFDFNDARKRDPGLMLRSLLYQLLECSRKISSSVDTLLSLHEEGQRQPSQSVLLEETKRMIQGFGQVFIVIDALDECNQCTDLMEMLETIIGWQLQNLHLLLTSRREREIESSMTDLVEESFTINLESHVVDSDIQRYVRQKLTQDKALKKWGTDPEIRAKIESALMQGARGMFRWAACQLDTLGRCRNRAMLHKSLASLPPTLDQTYERILIGIKKEDFRLAFRILQWVTFSSRPLSLEEIAHAAAIDADRESAFDRDEVLEDPMEALDICSSLVVVVNAENKDHNDHTRTVDLGKMQDFFKDSLVYGTDTAKKSSAKQVLVLAHYSVQEYLLSDMIQQGKAGAYSMQHMACHDALARSCLHYILQSQEATLQLENLFSRYPLAHYAAKHWTSHLQKSGEQTQQAIRLVLQLFDRNNPAYLNWTQLHDPEYPDLPSNISKDIASAASPLYYSALLGFRAITSSLLERGSNMARQYGLRGNALQVASYHGNTSTVQLLLEKGAGPNKRSFGYNYALFQASIQGHKQCVMLLLQYGAQINYKGPDGTALSAACFTGHEEIVRLLLDKGANPNVKGRYSFAISEASRQGHLHIVRLLLERGADPNARGYGYEKDALDAAIAWSHIEIVELLLGAGAHSTASKLYAAAKLGNERLVKVLLDRGANPSTSTTEYGGDALDAAITGGHQPIVELLLGLSTAPDAQKLYAASRAGHNGIVKLLVQKGINVNTLGTTSNFALHAASAEGHKQTVEFLLASGAWPDAQTPLGTALQQALLFKGRRVVETLLRAGASPNVQGGKLTNPLDIAISKGYHKEVAILRKYGARAFVDATSRTRMVEPAEWPTTRFHY
ncbi:hypothetical protein ACN47E_005792 [Coniothyrium glycines]